MAGKPPEDQVDEEAARAAAIELYGVDVVESAEAAFDETCLLQDAIESRTVA